MGTRRRDTFYTKQLGSALMHAQVSLETWTALECEDTTLRSTLTALPATVTKPHHIPVGKKAFFTGYLTHTNEILVLLGANYFALRSASQAVDIVDRRLATVRERVEAGKQHIADLRLRLTTEQQLSDEALEERGFLEICEPFDKDDEDQEEEDDDDDEDEDEVGDKIEIREELPTCEDGQTSETPTHSHTALYSPAGSSLPQSRSPLPGNAAGTASARSERTQVGVTSLASTDAASTIRMSAASQSQAKTSTSALFRRLLELERVEKENGELADPPGNTLTAGPSETGKASAPDHEKCAASPPMSTSARVSSGTSLKDPQTLEPSKSIRFVHTKTPTGTTAPLPLVPNDPSRASSTPQTPGDVFMLYSSSSSRSAGPAKHVTFVDDSRGMPILSTGARGPPSAEATVGSTTTSVADTPATLPRTPASATKSGTAISSLRRTPGELASVVSAPPRHEQLAPANVSPLAHALPAAAAAAAAPTVARPFTGMVSERNSSDLLPLHASRATTEEPSGKPPRQSLFRQRMAKQGEG